MPGAPMRSVDVVALGGGHGLAASLQALRRVTPHLTAVVGVSCTNENIARSLFLSITP